MVRSHAWSAGVSTVIGGLLLIGGAGQALAQEPPPETQAPPSDTQAPPSDTQAPAPGNQGPPPGAAPAPVNPPPVYPSPYITAPPLPPRENSINASPLGVFFGSYALNYERLVSGTHGFLIEGVLSHVTGNAGNGTYYFSNKSTVYGGAAGYRWHWSGSQQSGFLGLMAGYTVGTGTSTATSAGPGGTTTAFDMTVKAPWVVANIGKRWQWDSGINITFRIGGGWAWYSVSTTSTDTEAMQAKDSLQDLLTRFPIAVDGELSIGYSF